MYKKLLEKARQENIDICSLEVANELDCCLDEEGVSEEKFNEACSLIENTYLHEEQLSVNAITLALLDMVKETGLEKANLKEISRRDLAGKACWY